MKSVDRVVDRFSLESLKLSLLHLSYEKKDTLFCQIDPRVLLTWYLLFAITPWLTHNKTTLLLFAGYAALAAALARVSGLAVLLIGISTFANLVYLAVITFWMGGNPQAFLALLTFTLKLVSISLMSIAVFSSLNPERFSDALLKMGFPLSLSFGVAYGYRMLPLLTGEYHNLVLSFRLRGKWPERSGLFGWKKLYYLLNVMIRAFYPLMLNTAKRTRTTVEALELKGFSYACCYREARRIRLAYMKTDWMDWLFLASSLVLVLLFFVIGKRYPL